MNNADILHICYAIKFNRKIAQKIGKFHFTQNYYYKCVLLFCLLLDQQKCK